MSELGEVDFKAMAEDVVALNHDDQLTPQRQAIMAEAMVGTLRSVSESAERRGAEKQWQPIETAPKDGTKILGFAPHPHITANDPSFRAVIMWWRKAYAKGGKRESEWPWRSVENDSAAGHPTHWMPLPPAPTEEPSL